MIAQIIITSVLLAFVQHFETSSKDRVQEAKDRIPGEGVVAKHGSKLIRGKVRVRDEADTIRVRKSPKMMPLRVALYVMFLLLALLMAAGEQGAGFQDWLAKIVDIHRMSALLWWVLVILVAVAGGWMVIAGVRITAYEERIEKFLIWLDGADLIRSGNNSSRRRRRNAAASGSQVKKG